MEIHVHVHESGTAHTLDQILHNTEILMGKADEIIAAEAVEAADIATLQTAVTDLSTRVSTLQANNATVVAALQAEVDAGNTALQPALDAALTNNTAIEASVAALGQIATA